MGNPGLTVTMRLQAFAFQLHGNGVASTVLLAFGYLSSLFVAPNKRNSSTDEPRKLDLDTSMGFGQNPIVRRISQKATP